MTSLAMALIFLWLVVEASHRFSRQGLRPGLSVGRSLLTTARISAVVGVGIGAASAAYMNLARSSFAVSPNNRPTREDTEKALADYNAVIARCNADIERLRTERLKALTAVPEAKTATDTR